MNKFKVSGFGLLVILLLGFFLVSCESNKTPLTNLGEDTGPIDYTSTNMFSSILPGKPDLIKVVHIFRKSPGKPEKGGGNTGSADTTDYKLTGVKWTHGATYYVQSRADIDVNTVFANAFHPWNNAEPNAPVFSNSGTPILPTGASYGLNVDNVNTISFGGLSMYGGDALAVTQYVYNRRSRETVEFDQVFNDTESWTVYPVANEDYVPGGGTGSFDLPDVATHEHGHIFGLSDLYNSRDKYLTMYGYASAGETLKRTLGQGDILGIKSIY